jgi:hypothetical protein
MAKIKYVVVRDKRVEDFIRELFVILLTMLGIDKILARKYR